MTAREAASLLDVNPIQVSQIESGRSGISEERLRRLAAHYACADQPLLDALVEMALDRTRGWWEEFRGLLPQSFLDLSELEHHATRLRNFAIVHIPGLLQTQEYARAVFSYRVPELPDEEVEQRVHHRMTRQEILTRRRPKEYSAILHESALRIRVGTRMEARAQLGAILEASERDNITIKVIPWDMDGFAGAFSAMVHAEGPVPSLDTVQQDVPNGSGFVDSAPQLAASRVLFRKVESAALSAKGSREYIQHLMREI